MSMTPESPCRGRRRDASIDQRVLEVTNRQLAGRGFEALSFAAIAEEACTTRQALYRRWPSKTGLVADAIRMAADQSRPEPSDDPRADLEQELADFQRQMSRPGVPSLVGTMLQASTHDDSRECYRAH